jgi:hypothetical protein
MRNELEMNFHFMQLLSLKFMENLNTSQREVTAVPEEEVAPARSPSPKQKKPRKSRRSSGWDESKGKTSSSAASKSYVQALMEEDAENNNGEEASPLQDRVRTVGDSKEDGIIYDLLRSM